jgi:hypothetical protein
MDLAPPFARRIARKFAQFAPFMAENESRKGSSPAFALFPVNG